MSGLVGSLEAISTSFDGMDPKDIGKGIKECIDKENRILSAEQRKVEESQKKTLQKEIDSATLTFEIREDMGEEIKQNNKEQDLER